MTPAADTEAEESRAGGTIAGNTAYAFATQVATAAFTAGVTFYLVRALGPDGYGLLSLALAFGGILLLPSDFGLSYSAARFVAEERGNRGAVAAVLSQALRLKLITTLPVSLLLAALAGPIASAYGEQDLVWPLRGIALALFGQSVLMLHGGAFVALGRTSRYFRIVLGESVVEATATVALVALGGGVTGAAFGRAAGYIAGAALGIAMTWRAFGPAALSLRKPGARRHPSIARYAGAMLVINGAFTVFSYIDVLLIGVLLGPTAAGLFGAPLRFSTLLHYPGLALSNGLAPRMARSEHAPPATDAFLTGLRWLVILQAAIVVPVVVWAEPIVRLLLGPDYGPSAGVVRALAPYIFLQGIGPLVSVTVNYLGGARRRIPVALGAVAINVVVDLALIPTIGIEGAAIGTDLAYLLYVPAHLAICASMLGLDLRPLARTLMRAAVAATAMAAVLVVAGTSDLSLAAALVGGLGGLLAFGGTLLLLREVSLDELRLARRAFARALPLPS
jgi:O-antigen/teichoic acid export membrane protein